MPGSMSSSRLAISLRAAPSSSCDERRGPAAKNTQSPGFAPTAATSPSRSASEMFLATGPPSSPSSAIVTYARPLRAARLRPVLPGVERPPRLRAAAGHDDGADVGRLEHPERGVGEVVGQLGQLDAEAQVGLVRPEPVHRLAVGHPRDLRHVVGRQLAPQRPDDVLGDGQDVVAVDEAHLEVELGELRLPVGAEVLVPEAAGDLVVPLEAADHQQLLEQLRRLRQRVPLAGLQPHRDDEVAGALGRRAGQRRRLHLDEPVPGHHPAGDPVDLRAQPHAPSPGPAGAGRGSGRRSGRRPRPPGRSRSGTAAARTPTAPAATSSPPRSRRSGSSAFSLPSGRRRTSPVTSTQYSLRRWWASSSRTTTCT